MRARLKSDFSRGLLWWVPGALVFFRHSFTSGFDKIMGDDRDTRLIVFIQEHWVQAARGQVSWTSPEMFFPVRGSLGYSETFFLNEVFYLPLRLAGLDQFVAFQWTLILLSLVGFVSLFVFLRRTLRLGSPTCAALTTIFVFANNLYVSSDHSQLYAVYWLPLLLLLGLQAATATNRKAQVMWGWSAGALLGLLFYSAFYVAWSAVVGAIVVAVVLLVRRLATRGFAVVVQSLRRYVAATAGSALGFLMAMIPFAITYLPVLRKFPDREYKDAMFYAAWPSDVVNLSDTNYLWGAALRRTLSPERLVNVEVSFALTPVLMLAVIASCVTVFVRRRSVAVGLAGEVAIACTMVLGVLMLLPIKFGTRSLWAVAYEVVPGAAALRAIDRIMVVAGLFAVIIVGIAIRLLQDASDELRTPPRFGTIAVTLLLGIIVVEQFNVGDNSGVDRSDQLQALAIAPEPPDDCRAFYITDSGEQQALFHVSTIDAMLLAQHFQIPTINGYSGQFPPGHGFDVPDDDYIDRVHDWAETQGVAQGLCSYDRITHVWSGPEA